MAKIKAGEFRPSDFQVPFSADPFLWRPTKPNTESLHLDVVFVGAGPAGLAGAIESGRLAYTLRITLFECLMPTF